MKYEKIIKWILVALFIVGLVFSVYGFIVGFETNGNAPVDMLLYCTYAFALAAIVAVLFGVFVIGGMNNPKTLVKLIIGVLAIVAVVGGAWMLAPGSPAIGYMGNPVTDFDLKLTDTMLSLTYLIFGAAIVSLIVGWVVGATRK